MRRTRRVEAASGNVRLGADRRQTALLVSSAVVVGLLVAGTHWPALSARALSFDDPEYISHNSLVQNPGWDSTRRFLTELLEPSTIHGYAQPLAMISLMLDYASGGREDNLRPFHRTALALHVANTVLVLVFLYQLFGLAWPAAVVSLLYGLHPLTVEPVVWIGERKTLLAAFFVMWSLILYVRYTRTKGRGLYAGCLVTFLLALLSKPTSTPLPVLLLLLDAWPLRRLSWRTVAEKVPFLVLAGLGACATVIAQHRTAGIELLMEHSLARVPLMICHLIVFYLSKIVWPTNLSSVYSTPQPVALSNPVVLTGVIGTCVLMAGLLISLRWTRGLVVGWLFFFAAISPVLGVIGYSWITASDKYVYLPAVGLLFVLAGFLRWAGIRISQRGRPRLLGAAAGAALLALVGLEVHGTRKYLACWQDSESLFQRMLTVAPDEPAPHNSLGHVLAAKGQLAEAIEHYRAALRVRPNYENAHNNLALALSQLGRLDEAIEHCRAALRVRPDNYITENNLGGFLLKKGNLDEAAEHFRRALRLRPDAVETYNNLAKVLIATGRPAEAVDHLSEALRRRPGFVDAHLSLARAQALQQNLDQAITHYRHVLRLVPEHAETHNSLAALLITAGRANEAVEHLSAALRRRPDYVDAHHNMGRAQTLSRDFERAADHYREALRLRPDHLDALNNLAWLLSTREGLSSSDGGEAIPLARRACQLTGNQRPAVLDTLAAAYAAAGRFPEAITTAQQAMTLAHAQDKEELAEAIRDRLKLYQSGRPYRQQP